MASTLKTVALAAILLATGTAALAQDQVVRIGVSGPLSGSNAFAGKDDENGVRLAVEELNAQKLKVGGKTLKFEVLSEDDQGDPKAGVSVAQKFADAGVKFVLGPYNSGVAIPASRVSWTTSNAVNGVGSNGTLSKTLYTQLYQGNDNATSGSVDIAWQLAAPGVPLRSGAHVLTLRWKLESIH